MEHRKVSSSHIASVAHDPESGVLEVRFKNGATYRYEGVDQKTHQRIVESPSVGQALHRHVIKPGNKGKLVPKT